MADTSTNGYKPYCSPICFLIGVLAGILVAYLLASAGGFGVTAAVFFGIIVALVAWYALRLFFCLGYMVDDEPEGDAGHGASSSASTTRAATSAAAATTAAAGAAAATSAAASASAASLVSESATLPGEKELADKKGDWKYEGDANAKPAAKKAPAKKAAAKKPAAKKAPAKKTADAKPAATKAEDAGSGTKPATLSAARDGGPDDLKQIKGVGPKLEKLLHSLGFYHFDQVAAWTSDEVAWVDQNLEGFKGRVSRDDWVPQAKVLAKGGTTEFSKKVKKGDVY
jgi:predicted flap endonuclease-1-like 5' DNA nuclease